MPKVNKEHPGVRLVKRKRGSRLEYIAKWVDPDTGREKSCSLAARGQDTAPMRLAWCQTKSREIAARRAELEAGARSAQWVKLADAIDSYQAERAPELAPRTRETVALAMRLLGDLADVQWLHQLTGPAVARLRLKFVALDREPKTINNRLGDVKAALNHWRRLGLVPATKDEIFDALRPLRIDHKLPVFLQPEDCRMLIRAAIEHDKKPRSNRVHFARFFVCVLLSGCRLGEVESWRWVDMRLAQNPPEIRIPKAKNKRERAVRFDLSPGLLAVVQTLKREGRFVWSGAEKPKRPKVRSWLNTLRESYGVPRWINYQTLRRTAATYATAIAGAETAILQHGHGLQVAFRNYIGLAVTDAATIEDALGIADLVTALVEWHKTMDGAVR